MQPIPFSGNDAHTFGSALVRFGRELASDLPAAIFHLPGFRLTVASDSGSYLATCRRALADDVANESDRVLQVAVLDYQTHPEMPRGFWSGTFDFRLFENGLKRAGMEGSLDPEYRILQFFDPTTATGTEALMSPGRFPPWISSFPLRNFLHWAYQSIGWRLVHAGTLGRNGLGVMLVGNGGSGKSATVLAGVIAGLHTAGDDYVAVEIDDTSVRAHPVARLMKQDPDGLHRLGIDVGSVGAPNWQNKHEFDLEVVRAGCPLRSVELDAILLPRIARGSRVAFSTAPGRAAMISLAPSNLRQLPGGWRQGLEFTGRLARALPAYYLDLTEDPQEIADAVAAFVDGWRP